MRLINRQIINENRHNILACPAAKRNGGVRSLIYDKAKVYTQAWLATKNEIGRQGLRFASLKTLLASGAGLSLLSINPLVKGKRQDIPHCFFAPNLCTVLTQK
ncbi:hypothetical protein H4J58_01955 [Colwellia sp. MB3u-70]|uniref:hypothetical protein n=1 Tax=Colwellia sp. MB3u-70 TaxID=2759819 RepID=UPI0015F3CF07|nr:hypothetical protein [Colwellia sp. MB3u-70]MBA6305899.1 hypothetical protein [Colwellia sp. MB3u-70]